MDYGIIKDIVNKINDIYNGRLDCKEQRADLYVYIDGNEETIKAVDKETIYFVNSEHDTNLYDADIQHLVYINNII